jgi:hypothetical protein
MDENNPLHGWVDLPQTLLTHETLRHAFRPLKLRPVHYAAYVTKTEEPHTIHLHPTDEEARLNIPLTGMGGSYTEFFTVKGEPKVTSNAQGVKFLEFEPEQCTSVGLVSYNDPTVLRVREPHRVTVPFALKTRPRVVVTFQFHRDPVFLLES